MKRKLITGFILFVFLFTAFIGCSNPAEFSILDITIEPDVAAPGEQIEIIASVINTSSGEGSYNAVLSINGTEEESKSITLDAGESGDVSFIVSREEIGDYDVKIGWLSDSFSIAEPAAFSLSDLVIEPSSAAPGEQVAVSASITNTGGCAGSHWVVLKINGNTEDTRNVTLGAGESGDIIFNVSMADTGDYDVAIEDLSGSFEVFEPADFSISMVKVEPSIVWPGEEVTISVSLHNKGGSEGSYDVVLNLNETEEETKSITLPADGRGQVIFNVSKEDIGRYDVAIEDASGYFYFDVATPLSIMVDVDASTWRDGAEPYDIYSEIEEKLGIMGVRIVEEGEPCDGILSVTYTEKKGGLYTNGQYGTRIICDLELYDNAGSLLLEDSITGETPGSVTLYTWETLYTEALADFKDRLHFVYMDRLIAAKLDSEYAISSLISALYNTGNIHREDIVQLLRDIGDSWVVEPLIQALLEDEDADVRIEAASSLGELGDIRAVEPLIQALLEDEHPLVREEAVFSLYQLGDIRAVEPLIQALLEDEEAIVRTNAARMLGNIGGIRAVEPLCQALLEDENAEVRVEAAISLGDIGDASAAEALIQALEDEDEDVQYWAEWALGQLED